MRTYKQIRPSKQSQEYKAAADYERGSYENENARQSPLWMDYYMAFYDLAALEQIETNNEIQGN